MFVSISIGFLYLKVNIHYVCMSDGWCIYFHLILIDVDVCIVISTKKGKQQKKTNTI